MPGNGSQPLDTPKWLLIVRFAQILLAIIVIGLAGYAVSQWGGYAFGGLSIFTAVATLIINGYIIASTTAVKAIYNYWAHLALDIYMIIMWISSMGVLAATAASPPYSYYYGIYYDYVSYNDTAKGCAGGAAGMAGILFILFVICVIVEAMAISKAPAHHGASATTPGGPQAYGAGTAPYGGAPGSMPEQKYEMTSPQGQAPPPQQYQGQMPPQAPNQPYVNQSPQPQQAYGTPPPQQTYQAPPQMQDPNVGYQPQPQTQMPPQGSTYNV